MKWSSTRPTEPGYYFMRKKDMGHVNLVWVQKVPIGLRLRTFGHPTGWPLDDSYKEGFEWQGPLLPEEEYAE